MEQCKKCGEEKYIENRTRMLCKECNFERIHGITFKEHQKQKAVEYAERRKQKANKVNPISDKQKGINHKMTKTKHNVSLNAIQEIGWEQCAGCMRSDIHLDKSHILSVKQRPDLQLDEKNINLLCRNCHEKWESGDIHKMSSLLCFQKDMQYIFDNDGTKFQKILFKIKDALEIEHVQRLAYLLDIFLSFEEWYCSKFENGKDKCGFQCGRCKKFQNG